MSTDATSTETHGPSAVCRRFEPLLDDLVDGQLTAAEAGRVRRHLAACEACAQRLAGLERLFAEVESLPRSVAPANDLWPDIAPRLIRRRRPATSVMWPDLLRRAAAAVALVALGGLLSQLLLPGWRSDDGRSDEGEAFAVGSEPRAAFALAEAEYLRARETLWAAVYAGRGGVSPETREVVEQNLRIIDDAIRELRLALETDPGNPSLESLLLARHRAGVDLLTRLRQASLES